MIEAEIHPLAARELDAAVEFYEEQVHGLGRRFLDAVEKSIEQILQFPEACPVIGDTVRQKPISRFPYSLFYSLEEDRVLFVAVAHQKRKPGYWTERLGD